MTGLPCLFVTVTTLAAGYLNIVDIFWPMATGPNPDIHLQGYINTICTVIMLVSAIIILVATARRSLQVLSGRVAPVLEVAEA